jgi:O-antigen ligase
MTGIRPFVRIVAVGLIGAAAAAVILLFPNSYLPFAFILGLLALLIVLVLVHPAWLMFFIAGLAPIVCMVRDAEMLSIGGTTLSITGLAWAFVAVVCVVMLAAHYRHVRIPKDFLPFFAFIGWTLFLWVGTGMPLTGLKDVLFYGLPPLFGVFTYWVISRNAGRLREIMEDLLLWSLFLTVGIYTLAILVGWDTLTSLGPVGIIESRGTALYLLIGLAIALSRSAYAQTRAARQTAVLLAILATATILFTLSRMAGFAALLLLSLAYFKPHRIREGLLAITAAGLIGGVLVVTVPVLKERFFQKYWADLWTMVQSLRTAGRDVTWQVTIDHALLQPWVGWGPGSARILVAQSHLASAVTEYYPHNEYLQVWHDTGAIGLGLLLLGYLPLLVRFWRSWRDSDAAADPASAARNMAAFSAVFAILVTSITANTLHYTFVTVPAFILVVFAYVQNRRTVNTNREGPPPERDRGGGNPMPQTGVD